MSEAVTNFIKNASLITVINFFIFVTFVLIGSSLFFFAQTKSAMRWFLLIGIVPITSGILAMYLKYKYADTVMTDGATPETIAASQREGLIDLAAGAAGFVVILILMTVRRRLNKELNG